MDNDQRVKLAVVLGGHWAAQMGGAQYQAKCLMDALHCAGGFDVSYLARIVPERKEWDGYRIVQFGAHHPGRAIGTLRQLPSLLFALSRVRPDVVYQRCLMPYTAVCALYCMLTGARFVFHVASDDDVRRVRGWTFSLSGMVKQAIRRFSEFGLRRADAVVVQTNDQAVALSAEHGFAPALVSRNFHPSPQVVSRVGSRSRLRVLWVANFKQVKNPELFVDLVEECKTSASIEFVMIGRPGDKKRYEDLHARISKLPNLRYVGELSVEEVELEIANSDLLVNTSYFEGFPNTFIQAWLRGVPVISWRVDPDGCISRDGVGLLGQSASDMKRHILDLDENRERLRGLSEASRTYAIRNHSMDSAKSLVDLLRLGRPAQE